MGNREDLLAGARKSILERGYANTTARDIANAAGVSLAAIGYHFGSKDRLLTEALTEAVGSAIGDGLEDMIREEGEGRSLPEAFAPTWQRAAQLFQGNNEALLASMENLLRAYRSAESREYMAGAVEHALGDTEAVIREMHPDLDAAQSRAVASFYFTLLNGLAVLWITNPDGQLPSGDELALAIETLVHR
jgi:AcrR family transcriptional regulator